MPMEELANRPNELHDVAAAIRTSIESNLGSDRRLDV